MAHILLDGFARSSNRSAKSSINRECHLKLIKLLATSATLSAAAFALPAQATLTTYTNLAAFQAAAGATSLETFSAAVVNRTTLNYSGRFNGFSLSSAANSNFSGIVSSAYNTDSGVPVSFNGQNFYGWGNSAGSAGPTTTFTFTGPATAFGFDFFNTDTTDRYSLIVNGFNQTVINFKTSGFFGIVATAGETFSIASIQSASFGGYVSTAGLDNVRVSANVPEPTGLALFGVALFGFAAARRKARK